MRDLSSQRVSRRVKKVKGGRRRVGIVEIEKWRGHLREVVDPPLERQLFRAGLAVEGWMVEWA